MTRTLRQPYVEFDEAGHRYFINGREVPSVTQVLHKAGHIDDRWFDEYSRWRGSTVHHLTMIEDRAGKPLDLRTIKPELRGYIKAARRYKLDYGIGTYHLVEHRVVCTFDPPYAGTLDRVRQAENNRVIDGNYILGQRFILIDYKTNKAGYVAPWCRMQTAAYGHALRPGYWWERHGVCLRPDGRYNCEIYPASTFKRDLSDFYAAQIKAKENFQ